MVQKARACRSLNWARSATVSLRVRFRRGAFHRALKQSYECLARGEPDPLMAGATHKAEQDAVHESIGMERLLAVERDTVEK